MWNALQKYLGKILCSLLLLLLVLSTPAIKEVHTYTHHHGHHSCGDSHNHNKASHSKSSLEYKCNICDYAISPFTEHKIQELDFSIQTITPQNSNIIESAFLVNVEYFSSRAPPFNS